MAFPSSYISSRTLRDILVGTISIDLLNDTIKVALFTDNVSGGSPEANESYGSGTWGSNEVSGTGYTAGGETISLAVPNPTDEHVKVKGNSESVSWDNATFEARGAVIYNSTRSNRVLSVINFGENKEVVDGTFELFFGPDKLIMEY